MYIVFEGIVGSGKSTQSRKLSEYLRVQEQNVVHVREPGSTPIAEDIRILAQGREWDNDAMHPLTNAYLYAAARAQMLSTVVRPALDAGKIVISDRSFLSSLAYQGEAQGLGFDIVLGVNDEAIRDILPDRVFYMDIDVDMALERTFDSVGDKWEKMGRDFFMRIQDGYAKCETLDIMQNRWFRIDANGTEDEIFQRILVCFPQEFFQ